MTGHEGTLGRRSRRRFLFAAPLLCIRGVSASVRGKIGFGHIPTDFVWPDGQAPAEVSQGELLVFQVQAQDGDIEAGVIIVEASDGDTAAFQAEASFKENFTAPIEAGAMLSGFFRITVPTTMKKHFRLKAKATAPGGKDLKLSLKIRGN